MQVYKGFVKDYPVVTIEDPFDQDDWEHYQKLNAAMPNTQVTPPQLPHNHGSSNRRRQVLLNAPLVCQPHRFCVTTFLLTSGRSP